MTTRIFSPEFKREAAQPVAVRGVRVAQAARDLDVHATVLRRWVREFGSGGADAFPQLENGGITIKGRLLTLRS